MAAASDAFKTWSNTTVLTRQRAIFESVNEFNLLYNTYLPLFRLQRLIRENADSLTNSIVFEQGKTVEGQINHPIYILYAPRTSIHADARGEITRGLQVVEHAASAPSLLLGDKIEGSILSFCYFTSTLTFSFDIVSRDMDTEVRKVPLGVTSA